jgi:hypothetical protein
MSGLLLIGVWVILATMNVVIAPKIYIMVVSLGPA